MLVGYARVSSKGQNLARQEESLTNEGCDKIFKDKASGGDFERTAWQELKQFVREGDCVVVHDLTRFGRNAEQIKIEWEDLLDKKVDIRVLNMPILDTAKYKDLEGIGKLMIHIVFEILSWQAEEERRRIRTAQREGIDKARKEGKFKGKPKRYTVNATGQDKLVYDKVIYMLDKKESIHSIAKTAGISRPTVYRIRDEWLSVDNK
ncbi:Putative transposon Tn552 DNA-invertase bin3 [Oceanobacillus oncorhynchi]|uniref:Putative transposon Tn552 DNA-invertase bin3 n=1 Tax=Oceanobacillus oncorhynchi TaxID=545501 RepID=A0A0A1M609_9BACI|nr:recombinase family protein [Oceanobacillus oncorhynchi]CEI80720.1 Putative transposon Tn552 DNA-invertase bin3 [Oceanobacillus oncorhynchi]